MPISARFSSQSNPSAKCNATVFSAVKEETGKRDYFVFFEVEGDEKIPVTGEVVHNNQVCARKTGTDSFFCKVPERVIGESGRTFPFLI